MHRLTQNLPAHEVPRPWTPVRVAVVGLGYWGPNLVRNLVELPDADLAYVCDLRDDALNAVGRRYPAVRCTTSFDEVLADSAVDGVAIATPVLTHYELARTALEAGKHVLVEKPLAASSREGEELLAVATARDLVLMAGHTFVYSPPVNVVHELIRSGELGEIYFISTSRVNLGLHQSDTSVAWDLGPHDFSILQYWLGELPIRVSALSKGFVIPTIPDVAFINLEFESGTIAHVELSWLSPSKLRRTAIVGSQKMVVYDDTSTEPVRIFDSGVAVPDPSTFGEYRMTYRTGDIVSPRVDPVEPLSLELADFCRCIREDGRPRSSARLGIDVVRIIEAVDASLRRNGAVVEVAANGRGAFAREPTPTWNA
jgi:predicted dehydrogenase